MHSLGNQTPNRFASIVKILNRDYTYAEILVSTNVTFGVTNVRIA